jgi:hypothetical protein
MENLIFLLTASLVLYKSSKKPRKTFIGDTNCSVNFSPDAVFDFTQSEEGDQLYFAEYTEKSAGYGVLFAKVNAKLPLEEAQEVMTVYLNRLRKPFNALYNTGVDLCQSWSKEDDCIKMVDYWQDEDNLDWKVKGYTDGEIIAVLYVKNINEITVEKQDEFLDSFCMDKW